MLHSNKKIASLINAGAVKWKTGQQKNSRVRKRLYRSLPPILESFQEMSARKCKNGRGRVGVCRFLLEQD